MRGRSRWWGVPVVAVAFVLMAGCGGNSIFVYKPGGPSVGGPKLPVKVAVLPFKDGTESFTKRGSVFAPEALYYNLAKSGISGMITALTPDLWAKAFADDMAASGAFRAVRFVYAQSESVDEDLYIEGSVLKATVAAGWDNPNEFALGLRALRKADNRPVWEKEITRVWKLPSTLYDGCRTNQCSMDRYHADKNMVMREMFAEARADLVSTLASLSGSRAGEDGLPPAASPGEAVQDKGASSPPAPESAEGTIERILKAK
ncbi:MAG: hypothetical protein PHP88_08885 [bacterium]|nr:hypothetical protein [bacterium]